ncbi:MAG: hypothetical protein C4329_04480 [Chitinophagaceae bacterium]
MVQTKPMQITNVGEEIGKELGAQMISSYRTANPSDVTSYCVGRNILEQILAQPGCAGVKFYNAYNEVGQKTLVYVGVNAEGNDMLTVSSINISGQLESNKGIVADRILVGGLENWFDWWNVD